MEQYDIDRIEKLREKALRPERSYDQIYYSFYRMYEKNAALGSLEKRFANAYDFALSEAEPSIDEGELVIGKPVHFVDPLDEEDWQRLRKGIVNEVKTQMGQDSHMAVDYEKLLKKGIRGVIEEIDGHLKNCTEEQRDFYECAKTVLQAVSGLSGKYAFELMMRAEDCEDERQRDEYIMMAEMMQKVPFWPADTFHEAVQSVSFLAYCLSIDMFRPESVLQYQLGHIDRYLYPYYERDIREGRLTKERAQLLLDCLGIMINRRVPRGLSSGYMVGGRDENGQIVCNDLTFMGMQVLDDIRLVFPAMGLCYTPDMPEETLRKACEILSHGRTHPAIFNDDLITKGLIHYGMPEKEARNYIHSTCVEITPVGSSAVWVASPYTNMPQLLLDIMDREYDGFDALKAALYRHLDEHIRRNLDNELENRRIRRTRGLSPLLSCFVNDCLAEGKDIERGGARYNWIMPSFVGVANLVDSLYAVKTLVFEEKSMMMAELKAVCDRNFEGCEPLRQQILNRIPKYGNDIPEIDGYFSEIIGHLVAECAKYEGYEKGFRLIPSVFCWIMHEQLGRETGATPDGRPAGFPLGDGSGPCQGREHNGPTASILSSTSWNHQNMIGGVAVNMKFSKKTFTEDSCRKVESLIRTYMERGGFEIQINVTDRETLLAAQKDPDSYRDLVVRIGGYSDYFTDLSPEMQAEILLRTEHEV